MSQALIIPPGYRRILGVKETERAIKNLKDFFELNLATELNLSRVTAPLFVKGGTGVNDDLNGVERPVAFPIKDMAGVRAEIVQSLAKWKRMQLGELGFDPGYGLYTDMNAIRPDETLDNTHSLYVDQWDWERVITPAERNVEFLQKVVRKLYSILKRAEHFVHEQHPALCPELPEDITFIHAEDLRAKYPKLKPKGAAIRHKDVDPFVFAAIIEHVPQVRACRDLMLLKVGVDCRKGTDIRRTGRGTLRG